MTFEANAFSGNPYLCGPPLARRCHVEGGGGGIGVGDGGGSGMPSRQEGFGGRRRGE
ncbi:hypothetical protein QJS10_CPB22g01062 [Acorus calamus]|uniref:Uncharacterized protein n=1 Tax=Acorus calamus TaxID=4465 RepID=A0AAV9C269_ACOCL|nr:hypothetical protein QJS10_CPB22g01062 [Acorus calamus]